MTAETDLYAPVPKVDEIRLHANYAGVQSLGDIAARLRAKARELEELERDGWELHPETIQTAAELHQHNQDLWNRIQEIDAS